MNVPRLKRFCREFPGATETLYEEPYNFLVYCVGGRKFAYFKISRPERWRFSTRVSPDRFVELTDVPGVKPARYRGRFHWITIVNVSGFPASYLTELVEWSYRKAFASLSNARQSAILASTDCSHFGHSVLLGDLHTVPRGPGANRAAASRRKRAGAGTCLRD